MIYKIRSDEAVPIDLCESDTIKSIKQNIYLILTTPRGSVPMYRNFGLPRAFVDKPDNVAQTLIAAEVREALEEFEPRATLVDVHFTRDEIIPGKNIVVLEVDI